MVGHEDTKPPGQPYTKTCAYEWVGPQAGGTQTEFQAELRVAPKTVRRAANPLPATVQHMRVNHRRLHVHMPQQVLHRADVIALLKQVRGEGMTKGVGRGPFRDARPQHRLPDRPLHHRFVKMMAIGDAGFPVAIVLRRWKHPLPGPGSLRPGILPRIRVRQRDAAAPLPDLDRVNPPLPRAVAAISSTKPAGANDLAP